MNKRKKYIIGYVLAFILLLFVGLTQFMQYYLPVLVDKRIKKELETYLNSGPSSFYQIDIKPVRFTSFFRILNIPEINIIPYDGIFTDNIIDSLPKEILRIKLTNLKISTDGVIDLLRKREDIRFREISLDKLYATVFQNKEGFAREKEQKSNTLGKIEFGKINFPEINISGLMFPDTNSRLLSVEGISFFGGLIWDIIQNDEQNQSQIIDYKINVGKIEISPADQLYDYSIDSIRLSGNDNLLRLFDARVNPRYSKTEFQNHITHQTDRMQVEIGYSEIYGFDLLSILLTGFFSADSIEISNGVVDVFRDRNLPFDELRRPIMLVKLIRDAEFIFFVPLITLSNIDISYSELPENGNQEGKVPFKSLQGKIENITNDTIKLDSDSLMRINAMAEFFGEALLSASFVYNLKDRNGGYQATGELEKLEFTKLNAVLTPLLNVSVMDGYHEKSVFSFTGNDISSSGNLLMHYSDLDINMEPERSNLRQNIGDWAGRNFLYYPSNPHNDVERKGEIYFERDPSRFVFHYWWQCYLSGIKNTVQR
jgi:hypothetical protein